MDANGFSSIDIFVDLDGFGRINMLRAHKKSRKYRRGKNGGFNHQVRKIIFETSI